VTIGHREVISDRTMDGSNHRISELGKRFARLTRQFRSAATR